MDILTCDQVNAQDDDEATTPVESRLHAVVPNSPPPSFHSRASSPTRRSQVDPDLADAFDDSDDDSDDEADDRQRLVRQTSGSPVSAAPVQPPAPSVPSGSRSRVMGGGIGSDGVFANMSARPETGAAETEKDEMPPVG